jgi:hypothetical protein
VTNQHPAEDCLPRAPLRRGYAICLVLAAGCGMQTPLDEPGAGATLNTGGLGSGASGGVPGAGGVGTGGAAETTSTWPAEVTIDTCEPFQNVTVGSYVVETNFWNQGACPGTQCMTINSAIGAFVVTSYPDCGETVASYPNVLYGCAWGTCSPGSLLPLPVTKLNAITSSWTFSVGGGKSDKYDVAYDIWFCADDTCSWNGFPGGAELMIWVNHQNLSGWQTRVGTMSLAGYTFDLWVATMGGGGGMGWTYLAYMIHAPMPTTLTDFDVMAFIKDALARGYLQNTWYLYAVQAGDELRTGGVPFVNSSFSVSVR